jgi:hypothetical protein
MHYSTIKPIVDEEEILIDRGSLKTKRKFAFLLEKGDRILINRILEVNEEVEVLIDYTYTEKSKRPKETIKLYTIKELIKE